MLIIAGLRDIFQDYDHLGTYKRTFLLFVGSFLCILIEKSLVQFNIIISWLKDAAININRKTTNVA